jgi:hypothetical protein
MEGIPNPELNMELNMAAKPLYYIGTRISFLIPAYLIWMKNVVRCKGVSLLHYI